MEREDKPPSYDEDNEKEDSRSSSKSGKSPFLASWHRFIGLTPIERQETELDDDEEDDEDEEGAAPKKRWTRLRRKWRKFYRKLNEETGGFPLVPRPIPAEADPINTVEAVPNYPLVPEVPQMQPFIAENSPAAFAPNEKAEDETSYTPEEGNDRQESALEQTTISPEDNPPQAEILNSSAADQDRLAQELSAAELENTFSQSEGTVFDRKHPEPAPPTEKETRKEVSRGPLSATIALLGAEYFGRRRADRKLQKELDRLKKDVKKGQEASSQLRSLAQNSSEQLAQVKQGQAAFEAKLSLDSIKVSNKETPEPLRDSPSPPEVAPPLYDPPVARRRAEMPPRSAEVPAYQKRPIEGTNTTEASKNTYVERTAQQTLDQELLEKPEKILSKVADAAEHDEPIERAYELRHEVKDEPAKNPSYSGAASVGSIVAQKRADSPALSGALPMADAYSATYPSNSTNSANQTQSLYKQALHRGFWGGILVIIFVLVMTLLY